MVSWEMIPFAVVLMAVIAAGVTDVRSFRIPNFLTLPLAISGAVFHVVVHGPTGLQNSILGLLFGGLVLMLLYLTGGVGAGDVKLLAAVGAWLGVPTIVYVFVVAALAGSLYSFALLFAQGRLTSAVTTARVVLRQLVVVGRHLGSEERVESIVNQADSHKRLVPFAVMVGIGLIVVMVGVYLV
jgi:prepilin peptidase CpaA